MPLCVYFEFTWTLNGSRDANMYQHLKKKILGRHDLDKALDDCIDDDFSSIGLGALTKVRLTYTPMISQGLCSKERSVILSKAR